MKMKRILSLTLAMMLPCVALAGKTEVIHGELTPDGSVRDVYAINEFGPGRTVDYGNYADAAPLADADDAERRGDRVTFRTEAERGAYRGTFAEAELPWLVEVTYRVDGHDLSARRALGMAGEVTVRVKIRRNPASTGTFFYTHGLTAVVPLNTADCRKVDAPGAVRTEAGELFHLTWTFPAGTEAEMAFSFETDALALPAIAVTAVRQPGTIVIPAGAAQAAADLRTDAQALLDALIAQGNAALKSHEEELRKRSLKKPTLTAEKYAAQLDALLEGLGEGSEERVPLTESEIQSQARRRVRSQVRETVETAVRAPIQAKVTENVRAQVRQQVEAGLADPDASLVEPLVDQQMQSAQVQQLIDAQVAEQMKSEAVQSQIDAQLAPAIRPHVEAAVRQQTREEAARAAQGTLTLQVALEMRLADPKKEPDEAAVAAEVAKRMQSADTQQSIDAAVDRAMQTAAMQQIIDAKTKEQCRSSEHRAQAEAAAETLVRQQVTAAVREQVREQVIAGIQGSAGGDVEQTVESQMQSAAVQQLIRQETEKQMQSAPIKAQIDAEVEKQMATEDLQAQVKDAAHQIRYSGATKTVVREENTELYEALLALRESLDEAVALRDRLAMQESADLAAVPADPAATVSFADSRNTDVDSVTFVLATEYLAAPVQEEAPAAPETESGLLDRLLDVFH